MLGVPVIAGGLAVYLGVRLLLRRRRGTIVRLRDGGRVRLVSSVALLSGSPADLLALEYVSTQPIGDPEQLRLEARNLVQTVGARAEFGGCRRAVLTALHRGERAAGAASRERVFTFRRADSVSEWSPTEGLD